MAMYLDGNWAKLPGRRMKRVISNMSSREPALQSAFINELTCSHCGKCFQDRMKNKAK
jgi:hypothetical protein